MNNKTQNKENSVLFIPEALKQSQGEYDFLKLNL